MSYIPNKAMPHAAPEPEDEDDFENTGFYEWDGEDDDQSILERMSELARDNPKTALGAGVALIAGAVAGLVWPFVKSKSSVAKRKQPAKTRKNTPGKSASAGTGGARRSTTARSTKAASAGTGTRKKSSASTAGTSTGRKSTTSKRTTTKAASTTGAAKTRKPRSDKGTSRKPTARRTKSDSTPSASG